MGSSPAQTPAGTRNAAKPHPNPGHAKPAPRDGCGVGPPPWERPWKRPGASSSAFPARRGRGLDPPRPKHRPWNPEHGQGPARTQATQNRPRAMSAGPVLCHGKGRGSASAQTAARFPRGGKGRENIPARNAGRETRDAAKPRPNPGHAKTAPRDERGAVPLPRERPWEAPRPKQQRLCRTAWKGPGPIPAQAPAMEPRPRPALARTQATQPCPARWARGRSSTTGKAVEAPRREQQRVSRAAGKGPGTVPAQAPAMEPRTRLRLQSKPRPRKPAPRAERGAGPLRRDARENRPARSAAAAF